MLCAVHRFTRESHPRNPRRNTQGSVWPSTWASRGPAKITVQSPITEALGEVQPQGPSPGNGAGGREEAAILPHLSTGAAVGSRESRVSAAGLLAPSGAASERRSGSLGFSAVHSVRCAAVLHLSENMPWAQRRHATAVARPGPLDVGVSSLPLLARGPVFPVAAGRAWRSAPHVLFALSLWPRGAGQAGSLPLCHQPESSALRGHARGQLGLSRRPLQSTASRPATCCHGGRQAGGRWTQAAGARVPGARAFPAGRLRRPAPLGAPSETQAASRCSEFAARPVASGEAAAPASPTVPSPAV